MYKLNQGKSTTKRWKRVALIAAVLIIVGAGVGGGVYLRRHKKSLPTATNKPTASPLQSKESVQADAQAGNEVKQNANKDGVITPGPQTPGTTKKAVTITVAEASTDRVKAYINEIIESGGTCSLTLTKSGSATVTRGPLAATANATTTDCPPFILSGTDYKGWTAVVTYSSNTSQGSSQGSTL